MLCTDGLWDVLGPDDIADATAGKILGAATVNRPAPNPPLGLKNAVADIHRQAAELSTAIAEKILRRNLNADDQRDLVNSSLEQLQTAGRL